jgi:hypothetical protein
MCPAVSKKQQQFMGIVHAIQKGEKKPSEATPKARAAAKSMKKKDVKDFASTKHKGLPEKVPENIEEAIPLSTTYGYTKDGVVIFKGSKKEAMKQKNMDKKKNPSSKFQMILSPDARVGDKYNESVNEGKIDVVDERHVGKFVIIVMNDGKSMRTAIFKKGNENKYNRNNPKDVAKLWDLAKKYGQKPITEVKSDQEMVKDGLRYAKKKYKYNAKGMKELAGEMLTYIKSGEIEDQPSMEAYIDFRHDEMKMGEIKEIIRGVVKEVLNEGTKVPEKFKKLAQLIIDKKGNFSTKDFEKLGIPFEVFLQMAQIDNKVLVKNAQKVLSMGK